MMLTCKTKRELKVQQLERQSDECDRSMAQIMQGEAMEVAFWQKMLDQAPNDQLRQHYQACYNQSSACLKFMLTMKLVSDHVTQSRRKLQELLKN